MEQVLSGPWGNISVVPIVLDCPSAQHLNDLDLTPYRQWIFREENLDAIRQHFVKADLSPAVCDQLLKTGTPLPGGKGFVFHPPDAIVRDLSPGPRASLYAVLSRLPANIGQNIPFCFRGSSLQEWFVGNSVPPATISLIEPLLYKRAGYLLFSDPQLVLPAIPERYKRLAVIRALRRMSTLRMRVFLKPDESPDSALAYWGQANRYTAVEPLLPALAMPPDGLSVTSLLPPFARSRLYTYPSEKEPGGAAHCNCHWTSLNFFNDPPDDAIATDANIAKTLATLYEPLTSSTRLGDIILFFDGNNLVHSCVYIAGDIVFTKNGAGTIAPYLLQHLQDVEAGYRLMYGSVKLGFCRRKGT